MTLIDGPTPDPDDPTGHRWKWDVPMTVTHDPSVLSVVADGPRAAEQEARTDPRAHDDQERRNTKETS